MYVKPLYMYSALCAVESSIVALPSILNHHPIIYQRAYRPYCNIRFTLET
ncbi:hypothetical protein [Methanobrevibacter sp.]